MEIDDTELMHRVMDGDEEAMRLLVERYQNELVGYFYNHCWDQAAAEDLAQTTFIKIYRARERYRATAKFRTYLYRVAHNALIDHLRRQRHHLSLDAEVGGESGRSMGDMLPGHIDQEKEQRSHHIRQRVQQAVEELSEGHRSVFILANNQGLKYDEISSILDIPTGTVKSRMHAAVRNLRGMLGDLLEMLD